MIRPSQYELRLRKWGIRKNLSADAWKELDEAMRRRTREGKVSEIEYGILSIPEAKAKKRARRHAFESTLDRVRREQGPFQTPTLAHIMSRGVRVLSSEPTLALSDEAKKKYLSNSSWPEIARIFDSIFDLSSRREQSIVHHQTSAMLSHISLQFTLLTARYYRYMNPSTIKRRIRRLLLSSPCGLEIDIDSAIALRDGQALVDLLKGAIYLLSNNMHRRTGVGELIIASCQFPTSRKALKRLLNQKSDIMDAFSEKLLHYAIRENDSDLVKHLIKVGVDTNVRCNTCYRFPFGCAIRSRHIEMVKLILDAGVSDFTTKEGYGFYLMMAFENSQLDIASLLLQQDIDVKSSFSKQLTTLGANALSAAVLFGGFPAVKLLAEHVAIKELIHRGVNQGKSQIRASPFELAASLGNLKVLNFLMEQGADIKYRDPNGYGSPVAAAAANGQVKMVKHLLSLGGDADGRSEYIWTDDRNGRVMEYHGVGSAVDEATNPRVNIDRNLRIEIVGLLLDHGARPSNRTLVQISMLGMLHHVQQLIADGLDPNSTSTIEPYYLRGKYSVLSAAIKSGNDALVEFLLSEGVNPDIPRSENDFCLSPLATAIKCKRLDLAEILIDRHADPRDSLALEIAIATSSANAFELIINKCDQLHGCSVSSFALSAMLEAIRKGDMGSLNFLLNSGVEVNQRDQYERSPLDVSASLGNLEIVCLLLSRGADPNLRTISQSLSTEESSSALCYLGSDEPMTDVNLPIIQIANCLIEAGARVNSLLHRDKYRAPLVTAVLLGSFELVDLYIRHNVDVNATVYYAYNSKTTTTALSLAAKKGYSDIVRRLLNAGADLNPFGPTIFRTPLAGAIESENVELVELLISRGANVDDISALDVVEGGTTSPLCIAAAQTSLYMVQILLDAGGHVYTSKRIKTRTASTPIQIAAKKGHLDILLLLLKSGEDKDAEFIQQYPLALRLAYRKGHRAIARHLQAFKRDRFASLNCDTDEEILRDVYDKRRDQLYGGCEEPIEGKSADENSSHTRWTNISKRAGEYEEAESRLNGAAAEEGMSRLSLAEEIYEFNNSTKVLEDAQFTEIDELWWNKDAMEDQDVLGHSEIDIPLPHARSEAWEADGTMELENWDNTFQSFEFTDTPEAVWLREFAPSFNEFWEDTDTH